MDDDSGFFEDFIAMPWADDPGGAYWHFSEDAACPARFASGLTWKEPGDLLHITVAGELNCRWAGEVAGWDAPAFVSVESITQHPRTLPGGPPGLFTSRGFAVLTRVELDPHGGGGPARTGHHLVAVMVHGDGQNLYQAVSVVTRPGPSGSRVPLELQGDAELELWADAGQIGMAAFRQALGL